MYLETLSLFFQPEFQEQDGGLPKCTGHVKLLEGSTLFRLSFSWKFRLREQIQGFQKKFRGNIFLYLLNIFATAASK